MLNLIKGIGADVVFSVLTVLLNLISIPIYITYLGLEQYGLWITLSAIVTLINLFDLSADQHIIKVGADNSIYKQNRWHTYLQKVIILKLISCLIITVTCFTIYQYLLTTDIVKFMNHRTIKAVLMLCALSSVLSVVIGLVSSILYSRGSFAVVSTINGLMNTLTVVFALIFVLKTESIIGLALGGATASVCGFILYGIYFYHFEDNNIVRVRKNTDGDIAFSEIIQYIVHFHLIKIIFLFRTSGFPIFLGYATSLDFVGLYSVIVKVPQLVSSLVSKINTPFASVFSNKISRQVFHELKNIAFILASVQALISIIFFIGLCMFLMPFIQLWTNIKFDDDIVYLSVSLYFSLQIYFSPYYYVIYANGEYGKIKLLFVLELLLFGITTFLFYSILAESGPIIALLISSLVTQIYIMLKALEYLTVTFRSYLNKLFLNIGVFIVISVVYAAVFWMMELRLIVDDSWSKFFIFVSFFVFINFLPFIRHTNKESLILFFRENFSYDIKASDKKILDKQDIK